MDRDIDCSSLSEGFSQRERADFSSLGEGFSQRERTDFSSLSEGFFLGHLD
jgi:hypothetical protein